MCERETCSVVAPMVAVVELQEVEECDHRPLRSTGERLRLARALLATQQSLPLTKTLRQLTPVTTCASWSLVFGSWILHTGLLP